MMKQVFVLIMQLYSPAAKNKAHSNIVSKVTASTNVRSDFVKANSKPNARRNARQSNYAYSDNRDYDDYDRPDFVKASSSDEDDSYNYPARANIVSKVTTHTNSRRNARQSNYVSNCDRDYDTNSSAGHDRSSKDSNVDTRKMNNIYSMLMKYEKQTNKRIESMTANNIHERPSTDSNVDTRKTNHIYSMLLKYEKKINEQIEPVITNNVVEPEPSQYIQAICHSAEVTHTETKQNIQQSMKPHTPLRDQYPKANAQDIRIYTRAQHDDKINNQIKNPVQQQEQSMHQTHLSVQQQPVSQHHNTIQQQTIQNEIQPIHKAHNPYRKMIVDSAAADTKDVKVVHENHERSYSINLHALRYHALELFTDYNDPVRASIYTIHNPYDISMKQIIFNHTDTESSQLSDSSKSSTNAMIHTPEQNDLHASTLDIILHWINNSSHEVVSDAMDTNGAMNRIESKVDHSDALIDDSMPDTQYVEEWYLYYVRENAKEINEFFQSFKVQYADIEKYIDENQHLAGFTTLSMHDISIDASLFVQHTLRSIMMNDVMELYFLNAKPEGFFPEYLALKDRKICRQNIYVYMRSIDAHLFEIMPAIQDMNNTDMQQHDLEFLLRTMIDMHNIRHIVHDYLKIKNKMMNTFRIYTIKIFAYCVYWYKKSLQKLSINHI